MRTLEQRLKTIRDGALTRISAPLREHMHRATEELEATGIVAKARGVGVEAPPFTLPNSVGEPVSLSGLLAAGPVVLTFFRGHW